jgi:ribosomal-protein-alanine N-acetyltransferase
MNTDDIDIGLAKHADSAAIAGLSRQLIEHGLRWRYTPNRIAGLIDKRGTNVATAKQQGALVGFGIMTYYDHRANLDLLAVVPGYTRRGIGKRIVDWLEHVAITAGLQWTYVQARETNRAALAFYKTLGYQRRAVRFGIYDGLDNSVRMIKDLYKPCDQLQP